MSTTPIPSPAAESPDSRGFPPPATLEPGRDSAPEDGPWPAPASEYRTLQGHIPDLVDPLDPQAEARESFPALLDALSDTVSE